MKLKYIEEDRKKDEEEQARLADAILEVEKRLDEEEKHRKHSLGNLIKPIREKKNKEWAEYRQSQVNEVITEMEAQFARERAAIAARRKAEEAQERREELQRIEEEKRKRREEQIEKIKGFVLGNKKKVAGAGAGIALAIIALVSGVSISNAREQQRILEQYDAGVECVVAENYSEGKELLKGLSINDSEEIIDYCDKVEALDNYDGTLENLYQEFLEVNVENSEVKAQCEDYLNQVKDVYDVEKNINAFDLADTNIDDKIAIAELEKQVEALQDDDPRIVKLLSTDIIDSANEAIYNMEERTPVGLLILSIYDIGTVTLESEDVLDNILDSYKALSDEEKTKVINYSLYDDSRKSYNKQVLAKKQAEEKAEAERIAAEKKAEEERLAAEAAKKAEQEKLAAEKAAKEKAEAEKAAKEKAAAEKAAAEKAEQERVAAEQKAAEVAAQSAAAPAPQNSGSSATVWIPASGSKYHSYPGCSGMINPTQTTQANAVAMHYGACSKCW